MQMEESDMSLVKGKNAMIRVAAVLLVAALLQGCSYFKKEDLKSPCVGTEDSPCGAKRPVNDWWMKA